MKKVAIYIGKFQPFHKAHQKIVEICKEDYDETIVLVGSVNRRSSVKTPFAYITIKTWVKEINPNVIVKPIKDFIYNETKWITQVEDAVYSEFYGEDVEFTIVGHHKDETSYYLEEFPNFKVREINSLMDSLSGTDIRNKYFLGQNFKDDVPFIVYQDMYNFKTLSGFKRLTEEFQFYQNEKEMFKNYPFPETLKFMCSDAVVICDGNILLIERKIEPGKGVWALPGGFVNQKETFKEAAIRELIEETGIKIPYKSLEVSICDSHIFDNPNRNLGIPRISNAFLFKVFPDKNKKGYPKLPKIKAGDDAANAKWFSLAEVRNMYLFDDHADIIDYFVNSL